MIPESNNVLTLSVTSPYDHPLNRGERFICVGWSGDGVVVPANEPPGGPYDQVDVVVDAPGYITWEWAKEFKVETISDGGVGVPDTESWFWFANGATATVTGLKYVEGTTPGYGYRCDGFIGTGSAPGTGNFLAEDAIELSFTITEYSTVTWTWREQYKLTVDSPAGWGDPDPAAGELWYDTNVTVNATIDPVDQEGQTILHELDGYTLVIGSNPPITDTGNLASFTISAPSVLTWHWTTSYLLDVRNPQFIGVINPSTGTYWVEEGTLQTCSAVSPTDDGVNVWLAIGYDMNGDKTFFTNFNNPQATFTSDQAIQFAWIWELETLPFEVISQFGVPTPDVGTHYYPFDTQITATVPSPYYPSAQPGVMHVCTGFSATGSITPSESSRAGLSVIFRLRERGTTLTWNWYTQYQLVILSEQPDVMAEPEMRQGGYWFPEGTVIDASVEATIPSYRCSGYLMTEGAAQSSGNSTFVSFPISAPTTITWQWVQDEILAELPDWYEPLQISDSSARNGLYASMRRDPVSGRPSVAYYKVLGSQSGALYYAYWDGVNWHHESVDEVEGGNVGLYANMELDSFGRPHIAYYDRGAGSLKYALRTVAGGWRLTEVDTGGAAANDVGSFCSLELNDLNEPRISYFDESSGDLKYAALENGLWKVYVVDSTGDVGSHTSIALDPVTNAPRIAYRDNDHKALKFAWFENDQWQTQTVDDTDDTGYTPSMVLDETGAAHIAYQMFNGHSSALIYSVQSGSKFFSKTVAAEGEPSTGFVPSLKLDGTRHPHIAYNDIENHSLIYSVYNGEQWLSEELDTASVGSYVSLDLFEEVPAVAYWSFSGLRYVESKSSVTTGGNQIPQDGGTEEGDGGGGGCFIATAAFGTYGATAVESLCAVRDTNLAVSLEGSELVSLYYAVSPAVATELGGTTSALIRALLNDLR
ncbi:MAG: CFI-box-CTERM domain-containing protein [Planctomycetota bacterium]|nr:CFI-box-CTERM domain-containing protein [Planctomycetota bacterium]